MDRILPIDLQRHGLKTGLRGYDPKTTEELLQQAAESLSAQIAETEGLRAKVATLESELQRYRAEESLLREALVLAQRTADETRAVAHREADAIREEARLGAENTRMEALRTADALRYDVERLRLERARFQDDFRDLLHRYLRDLGDSGPTDAAQP